ncbi:L-asparaginase [Lentibacillus kapialis]|uniref:asparaginase n=1 Tax=Lentibacillus kapialis TaxID=340214 RepID=A0A917PNK2_9BACI|nr:asparaginase [Lentibacillus kapialis]GGJ85827.1 L-asparaginase [Lentibacillus kapialis]
MKRILIIHTGGTISMLENKQTGEITTTDKHPLTNLKHKFGHYAHVEEVTPFSVPSPQITPQHMLQLALIIKEKVNEYDGFVVTHGTDTLEETAYFLDLVSDTDKPIIVTGAMRSANEIGSDALYNLISSLRTATSDDAWNKGVLVVMNDEIHTARNVTKTSTSNVATFQSPQYGPIGSVTKNSIIFYHPILTRHSWPVSKITQHVFMLKAYAGMNVDILESVHQNKPDGLVLEGLGQGNLPKQTLPSLKQFIHDKIPIILVSRCYKGIVQPTYDYDGGGKQLKDMGVIFADGLTGPKARLKLLVTLEITSDIDSLKEMFKNNY